MRRCRRAGDSRRWARPAKRTDSDIGMFAFQYFVTPRLRRRYASAHARIREQGHFVVISSTRRRAVFTQFSGRKGVNGAIASPSADGLSVRRVRLYC